MRRPWRKKCFADVGDVKQFLLRKQLLHILGEEKEEAQEGKEEQPCQEDEEKKSKKDKKDRRPKETDKERNEREKREAKDRKERKREEEKRRLQELKDEKEREKEEMKKERQEQAALAKEAATNRSTANSLIGPLSSTLAVLDSCVHHKRMKDVPGAIAENVGNLKKELESWHHACTKSLGNGTPVGGDEGLILSAARLFSK